MSLIKKDFPFYSCQASPFPYFPRRGTRASWGCSSLVTYFPFATFLILLPHLSVFIEFFQEERILLERILLEGASNPDADKCTALKCLTGHLRSCILTNPGIPSVAREGGAGKSCLRRSNYPENSLTVQGVHQCTGFGA